MLIQNVLLRSTQVVHKVILFVFILDKGTTVASNPNYRQFKEWKPSLLMLAKICSCYSMSSPAESSAAPLQLCSVFRGELTKAACPSVMSSAVAITANQTQSNIHNYQSTHFAHSQTNLHRHCVSFYCCTL